MRIEYASSTQRQIPTPPKSVGNVSAQKEGRDLQAPQKGVCVIDNAHASPLSRLLARETARLRAEVTGSSTDVLKRVAQISANEEAALSDAQINAIYSRMAAL